MKQTPFYQQHLSLKARIVPFAGFQMPLNYSSGTLKEHEWVRTRAGLFDVSHMQQCTLSGKGAQQTLEYLTPTDFSKTVAMQAKYTVLLNSHGGIIDDCIITKLTGEKFLLVLNASRAQAGLSWIQRHLKNDTTLIPHIAGSPLLALQGPYAHKALENLLQNGITLNTLQPMHGFKTKIMGIDALITRTGYTGEDGFELALNTTAQKAQTVWHALLQDENIKPIGLGARDTLRLEAGFPLYGQDLTEEITPPQAGLNWIVRKDDAPFLGSHNIYVQQKEGVEQKRTGILLTEQGIARAGTAIFSLDGQEIGTLTSGGICPTTHQSIGQGYLKTEYTQPGTPLLLEVRKKRLRGQTHALSFLKNTPEKPSA